MNKRVSITTFLQFANIWFSIAKQKSVTSFSIYSITVLFPEDRKLKQQVFTVNGIRGGW